MEVPSDKSSDSQFCIVQSSITNSRTRGRWLVVGNVFIFLMLCFFHCYVIRTMSKAFLVSWWIEFNGIKCKRETEREREGSIKNPRKMHSNELQYAGWRKKKAMVPIEREQRKSGNEYPANIRIRVILLPTNCNRWLSFFLFFDPLFLIVVDCRFFQERASAAHEREMTKKRTGFALQRGTDSPWALAKKKVSAHLFYVKFIESTSWIFFLKIRQIHLRWISEFSQF